MRESANSLPSSSRSQALTLAGLIGFQAMDALTTHIGLGLQHAELNRVMAPIIAYQGELAAYAVKGTALAMLLALLMLAARRAPRIWYAYQVAACLTAVAVIANLLQVV